MQPFNSGWHLVIVKRGHFTIEADTEKVIKRLLNIRKSCKHTPSVFKLKKLTRVRHEDKTTTADANRTNFFVDKQLEVLNLARLKRHCIN